MPSIRDIFPVFQRHAVSAASMRAPIKGEILPITVTTASKRFAVPAAWKGHFVRITAEGGDLYVQVSRDATATANKDARAAEANTPIELTAPSDGADWIPKGASLDVPFPSDAETFAIQGSAACVARCHLAES